MKTGTKPNQNSGFTLVELLVVISILVILAGATISIINPKKQRQKAEDGIRSANLEKLATGIEAYGNANGKYPLTTEMADANTDNVPDGAEAAVFISKIPNNQPTDGTTYTYFTADQNSFSVSVPKASDATWCFKYSSAWGKISECVTAQCNVSATSCASID